MTTLTPEERILGRSNANVALGLSRRDFLKAAAAAPAAGAFYFGYTGIDRPVRAAIIGTGNEGCQAMIRDHNRAYLDFIGYCDVRPTQQKRARDEFAAHADYSAADVEKLKQYADTDEMLADPDVEVVVIALPLWLHAPVSIKAMKAGKHVFCEKLMAHSVGECKAMCRTAREENKLLGIGHQRHYSALYDNANYLVQNGFLGPIRHIRALWHRNNACPRYAKDKDGNFVYDAQGNPELVRDEAGNVLYFDSWKPDIPADDQNIDYKKYGYTSLDELIRWRLYNRTGAGLMAELGSHQLDACSIFLGKAHPLAVTGFGGTFYYKDGREVDDHVFTMFEFPAVDDPEQKVVVTYSSINTNSFENYGEMVYGTRGSMIVEGERELLLYKELDRNVPGDGWGKSTSVTVETKGGGKPALTTSPTAAGPSGKAVPGTVDGDVPSRGYREELEHFAFCVRNGKKDNFYAAIGTPEEKLLLPRCRGEVALADAVIALTSNLAMRENRRINFEPAWFDYEKDDTPDKSTDDLAMRG
jgi:predicted dehydrogenase